MLPANYTCGPGEVKRAHQQGDSLFSQVWKVSTFIFRARDSLFTTSELILTVKCWWCRLDISTQIAATRLSVPLFLG